MEFGSVAAAYEEIVLAVASHFHDAWREPRWIEAQSRYEPRLKTTDDAAWIAAHGGSTVDIANTDFHDLPEDWRRENRVSAEWAVEGVLRAGVSNLHLTEEERHRLASQNHDEWVARHRVTADPALLVPFDELPESERVKDLDAIDTAAVAIRAYATQLERQPGVRRG